MAKFTIYWNIMGTMINENTMRWHPEVKMFLKRDLKPMQNRNIAWSIQEDNQGVEDVTKLLTGYKDLFDDIRIGQGDVRQPKHYIPDLAGSPVVFIGCRPKFDIQAANKADAITIRIKNPKYSKYAGEVPKSRWEYPLIEVTKIRSAIEVIRILSRKTKTTKGRVITIT